MSSSIDTREFSISDYDAAIEIWQRVEGVEIAEGDDRESVAQFLARNWGLSRVAMDGSDTFIIWRLILLIRGAASVSACSMNASTGCAGPG